MAAAYDPVGKLIKTTKKEEKLYIVSFDSEDDGANNVFAFDFYDGEKHYTFVNDGDPDYYRKVRNFFYTYDDIINNKIRSEQESFEAFSRELIGDSTNEDSDSFRVDDEDFGKLMELFSEDEKSSPVLKEKNYRIIFVAHNALYDICNLHNDGDFSNLEKVIFASRFITGTYKGLPHVSIMDTFNLYPVSLDSIGRIMGLPKIDFDHNRSSEERKNDPRLIPYLHRDTEICYRFYKWMVSHVKKEYKMGLPPTIGSLALAVFRRGYAPTGKNPKIGYQTFNHKDCIQAYYGGRVEVFFMGEITGEIIAADVNSMYPFAMLREFPDTETMEPGSRLNTHRFGVGRFKVYIPEDAFIPTLPVRDVDESLNFPVGEIEGYYTYEEIRWAMTHGAIVLEEEDGWGTNEGSRYFSRFITDLYAKREPLKVQIKEMEKKGIPVPPDVNFLYIFIKLIMNSCYGKFAQNTDKEEFISDSYEPEYLEKKKGRLCGYMLGMNHYQFDFQEPPTNANYIWAAYITSYARMTLGDGLIKVNKAGHRLLYCDTDSIMFLKKEGAEIPLSLHDSELGKWGAKSYVWGRFEGPKGYMLRDERGRESVTQKGLKVESDISPEDQLELNAYLHGVFDGFHRGEAIPQKRPVSFKQSFKRVDKAKPNFWMTEYKVLTDFYSKRFPGPDGVTRPLTMEQIIELKVRKKTAIKFGKKKDEFYKENLHYIQ